MKLLYLHLPKAGGSTIHSIIERAYQTGEVLTLKPNSIHPQGDTPTRYLDGVEKKSLNTDFNLLKNVKVIKGHFYFGLHKYIDEKCGYITMVRHPLSRVISQYYFTRNRENDGYGEIAGKIDLQTYVENDYEVNNLQTKILFGKGFEKVNDQEYMLNKVMSNINDHFSFIGLTEFFDQSLILFKSKSGLKHTYYRQQNISKHCSAIKMSRDLVELIEERNRLDIRLYNHVKEKFDINWNKGRFMNDFKLKGLRLRNVILNYLKPIPYRDGF